MIGGNENELQKYDYVYHFIIKNGSADYGECIYLITHSKSFFVAYALLDCMMPNSKKSNPCAFGFIYN